MMDEDIIDSAESIPAFYVGKSIFLTGATGFLGKVYIEKILRSCPEIREIFILMRPKKGKSINERLEEILTLPLYDKLRKEQPSNFKKIIPLSGNTSEENLGLSAIDRQILIERVSVVIHTAASVRFNDSLKYAIFTNIRSTRDVCILAQSMKNLIALVYVGTAYAHINEPIIEEKVYSPIADWRKMIKIAETLDEDILNIFTAKCLSEFPNTYIYSKNLAESIIVEYSSSLPCAIVRPSIIVCTFNDPFPGWMDNFNNITGLLIGGGKGVLRVFNGNNRIRPDILAVDIVVKIIIITTRKLGLTTESSTSKSESSTPIILNCTCSDLKSMSVEAIIKMGLNLMEEVPLEGIVWTSHPIVINNSIIFYILTLLLHILPGILIDLILKLMGYQPILIKLYRKIYSVNRALKHFGDHQWEFENPKCTNYLFNVSPNDKETFSCDPFNCDLKEVYRNSIIGAKKHLLYEDMNRIDAARTHYKREI